MAVHLFVVCLVYWTNQEMSKWTLEVSRWVASKYSLCGIWDWIENVFSLEPKADSTILMFNSSQQAILKKYIPYMSLP